MAGEPILIVDDTPVNLKLTRILLVNEGYKVTTAASAEEALELLKSYHPDLVLADIQLPGMDGLEFTRRVKQDDATRDIVVVALTAFAMQGDEQKAMDAGCDGYITKPIDTRALGERIRQYLNRHKGNSAPAAPEPRPSQPVESISNMEMDAIRRRFLAEGQEQSRKLLLDLDGPFSTAEAARAVHQWIGTGGLLGYTAVSRLSREVEGVLLEKPLDNSQLRESLTSLVMAFNSPVEGRDRPVPDTIIQSLAGKRVVAVGFPTSERERLQVVFDRAGAVGVFMGVSDAPDSPEAQAGDLVLVHVDPENEGSPFLDPSAPAARRRPLVFVGSRDHLLGLPVEVRTMAREFLMDSWLPEEGLVRLSLALSPRPAHVWKSPDSTTRPQVVVSDADPAVLAMIRTALQNFDMDCRTAVDGSSALELIRQGRPDAVVIDVNTPGMDGYGVLSAVRADQNHVPIVLLTDRQQEGEVLRGFGLGADDFMGKPFSALELVARLRRLLGR